MRFLYMGIGVFVISSILVVQNVNAGKIHEAAQKDDWATVDKLIKATPALIDSENSLGQTPFYIAVCANSVKTSELLIKKTNLAYTEKFIDARYKEGKAALKNGATKNAKTILSELLRKNPESQKINFAYGVTALSVGEIAKAKLAFERVLKVNPANERARVELARALIAMRDFDSARLLLNEVLRSNPPPIIKSRIYDSLLIIDKKPGKSKFLGRIELGAFDDDNINVGPGSDIVTLDIALFGIYDWTVDESSQPVHAQGLFSSLSLGCMYDFGDYAGWLFGANVYYYQNWLDDYPDHESIYAQTSVGLRRVTGKSMLHIPFKFSHITYGKDPLLNIAGITPSYVLVCDDAGRWQWMSSIVVELREWDDWDDRDGVFYALGQSVRHLFGRSAHSVSLGASFIHDKTEEAVFEYIGMSAHAAVQFMLPWETRIYTRAAYRLEDYKEKEVLAPEKRDDSQMQYTGGLTKMITPQWGVDATYQFTDNDSTFELYEYDRNVLTLSTHCVF